MGNSQYTDTQIGAVVGQLAVHWKRFINDDISTQEYQNVTSYKLVKMTGMSRYILVNILEEAFNRGYVTMIWREHRPRVNKRCYAITDAGIEFIEKLKAQGKYTDCVKLIVKFQRFKAQKEHKERMERLNDEMLGWK